MVIFDCNGVLVDGEPIANAVAAEEFSRAGIPMTPELVAGYSCAGTWIPASLT